MFQPKAIGPMMGSPTPMHQTAQAIHSASAPPPVHVPHVPQMGGIKTVNTVNALQNPRMQLLRQRILSSALRGGTASGAPSAPPTMAPNLHPVGMIK